MKKQILKILKPIALAMPLLSGLVGFLYAGLTFADALFDSISLYAMNFQDTPPNLWVEVGRWTAPLATASGIFLAVSALRSRVQNFLCYRRGDSVAVYGPEVEKAALLGRLGGRGMDGRGKYVRAARYILLGEEEENYDFYASHRQELEKREVYLRCSSLPSQAAPVLPGRDSSQAVLEGVLPLWQIGGKGTSSEDCPAGLWKTGRRTSGVCLVKQYLLP